MHQHDLDAHGLQQRDIGHERIQEPLMHHLAAETDDERLVTERMDVRGD